MGVQVPSSPINRQEQYLAKIAGQAVEIPAEPITREEAYLDYIAKHGGGGGGGTNDYDDLLNQPKINDVTLKGNKSAEDFGLADKTTVENILDGQEIDSFGDVENALTDKANASDVKKEFGGTLDQWNALTTAEKKEYDTYDITDDYSDGNYIYLPTIYSEEERQVGVWKDGKPLYQKTIDFGALPNNTSKSVASGLTGVSVKSMLGTAMASNGFTVTLPHAELSGAGSIDVSYLADNKVRISTDYDYSAYSSCITLQYTKTTDTAGSGTWTPTGEYAHHYSTDEQIIGTWIDGKTLYRKVVTNVANETIVATNVDTIVNVIISRHGTSTDNKRHVFGDGFTINDGGSIYLDTTTHNAQYAVWASTGGSLDKAADHVIIEYTKTA